jgi:hypothetical protein
MYTLTELEALPTLMVGQTDDLKIETPTHRVWLSRMTVADGMPYPNQVTEEYRNPGEHWGQSRVRIYRARAS